MSNSYVPSDAGHTTFMELQMVPGQIFPQCAAQSSADPICGEKLSLLVSLANV